MKRNNTALYLGENETTGIQITGLIIGSPEPLEGSVAAFSHPVITGQIKETNHNFFLDGSKTWCFTPSLFSMDSKTLILNDSST